MNFFKKLFRRDEAFVPTPAQQVPGLDPIILQAIENVFPNREDQIAAIEYSLNYKKDINKRDGTRLLLALLSYSQGSMGKFKSANVGSYQFMMDEIVDIFPTEKAARMWVKSISKP